jgi:hypothetical protein
MVSVKLIRRQILLQATVQDAYSPGDSFRAVTVEVPHSTSDLKVIDQEDSTPVQLQANGEVCCNAPYRSSAQRFFRSIFRWSKICNNNHRKTSECIALLFQAEVKMVKILQDSTGAIVCPIDMSRTMVINAVLKPPGF